MSKNNLWMIFSKLTKAKEIPSFTQFLVNNPFFRRFVIGFHNSKTDAINKVDDFLEQELLSKEELEKRKNAKRLDGKGNDIDPVQAFKNADKNKDGSLNKQEFLKSYNKTNRQ